MKNSPSACHSHLMVGLLTLPLHLSSCTENNFESSVPVETRPVACSTFYEVPGTSNPFLAGMPDRTSINYNISIDVAPINSPVFVAATTSQCLEPGSTLYFRVEGRIAHGVLAHEESDADGIPNSIGRHTLGNLHNIAALSAPMNSLLGVFLDDMIPTQRAEIAESLDFSNVEARTFKSLSPKIGQLFFIGDGKDMSGALQSFIVPNGTKRLYLAIMDVYEWNNNKGKLSAGILWVKPTQSKP